MILGDNSRLGSSGILGSNPNVLIKERHMLKLPRYLVFAFDQPCPLGGACDLQGSYYTYEEAVEKTVECLRTYEIVHTYDLEEQRIIL